MELFAVILVMNAIIAFLRMVRRKAGSAKPDPMCASCSFAHIQYGASGRRAISCTFGGGVRAMKLDVVYCTDYRNRYAPVPVVRVGFVNALEPAEPAAVASASS